MATVKHFIPESCYVLTAEDILYCFHTVENVEIQKNLLQILPKSLP